MKLYYISNSRLALLQTFSLDETYHRNYADMIIDAACEQIYIWLSSNKENPRLMCLMVLPKTSGEPLLEQLSF